MPSDQKHEVLTQFSLVHQLDFAKFYLDDQNKVMMVKYLDNVLVDIQKGMQVVDVVFPYIQHGAVCGMTDATSKNINITPETRSFYSSNKSMNTSIVHVVVLKELYLRILAKLFISFDKPTVPTKVFNDFDKAYEFLLNYQANFIEERNSSKVPSV